MTAHLRSPSKESLEYVGQIVEWSEGDNEPVNAVVVGAERTLSVIRTAEGDEFPGVRFRIKFADGRQRWTCTYADRGAA